MLITSCRSNSHPIKRKVLCPLEPMARRYFLFQILFSTISHPFPTSTTAFLFDQRSGIGSTSGSFLTTFAVLRASSGVPGGFWLPRLRSALTTKGECAVPFDFACVFVSRPRIVIRLRTSFCQRRLGRGRGAQAHVGKDEELKA